MRKLLFVTVALGIAAISFFISSSNKAATREVTLPIIHAPPETKQITVVLGGDVMLGRTVTVEALDIQKDASFPFRGIGNLLQSADITFINLENPIVENCPRNSGGFKFCAPPEMLSGMNLSGVDIVSLANNHTLNYGAKGISETEQYLNESRILFTGRSNLAKLSTKGITFGFLGFDKSQQGNPVLTPDEESLLISSNEVVDILIVAMHWGVEYKNAGSAGQRALARVLVEKGADVVVGHHPHWVQNSEQLDGKPIYYSLGNLIFDQMWSEETKKGLLVKLTFEGTKLVSEELLPTYMSARGRPELVD